MNPILALLLGQLSERLLVVLLLQILEQVALANDVDAWKLYNEFVSGMETQHPRSGSRSGSSE